MSDGSGAFFRAIHTMKETRPLHVALMQALRPTQETDPFPDKTACQAADELMQGANPPMKDANKTLLLNEARKLDARRIACETVMQELTNEIKRLRPEGIDAQGKPITQITQDLQDAEKKFQELDAKVHPKKDPSQTASAPAPTMSEADPAYSAAKTRRDALQTANKQTQEVVDALTTQREEVQKALNAVANNPLNQDDKTVKAAFKAADSANNALQEHREKIPDFSRQLVTFNTPIIGLQAVDEVCAQHKGTPTYTELQTLQTQLTALREARAKLADTVQMMTTPACVTAYKQQYDDAIQKTHACYTELNKTIHAQVKSNLHTLYGAFSHTQQQEDLRALTAQLRDEEIKLAQIAAERQIVLAEKDRPLNFKGKPASIPILGETLCGKGVALDETAPCTLMRTKWIPDTDNPKYDPEDFTSPNHWIGRFDTAPIQDYQNNLTLADIAAVVNEWNRKHSPEEQIRFVITDERARKFDIKCGNSTRANQVQAELMTTSDNKAQAEKNNTELHVQKSVATPEADKPLNANGQTVQASPPLVAPSPTKGP